MVGHRPIIRECALAQAMAQPLAQQCATWLCQPDLTGGISDAYLSCHRERSRIPKGSEWLGNSTQTTHQPVTLRDPKPGLAWWHDLCLISRVDVRTQRKCSFIPRDCAWQSLPVRAPRSLLRKTHLQPGDFYEALHFFVGDRFVFACTGWL